METAPRENFFLIDCTPEDNINSSGGCDTSLTTGRRSISLQTIQKLDTAIIHQIAVGLGITFISDIEATGEVCFANERGLRPEFRQSFTATDLLNYVYAVLNEPGYQKQYQEFLQTGKATISCPTDADGFWQLVKLGSELRRLP